MKKVKLNESNLEFQLNESEARKIKGYGVTCDIVNRNNRIYPVDVVKAAVQEVKQHLHESASQGRLLLGELEHPEAKNSIPNIGQTAIKWTDIDFDEARKQVILEGIILPTTAGNDLMVLLAHGIPGNLSQRGYGRYELTPEGVQKITELHITGYDVVLNPSDPTSKIAEILESEKVKMTYEELQKLIEENKDLFGDLVKGIVIDQNTRVEDIKLAESLIRNFLKLSDDEDIQAKINELREAKKQIEEQNKKEVIQKIIQNNLAKLDYAPELNEAFKQAVEGKVFNSVKEVEEFFEDKFEEYDNLQAKLRLNEMGIEAQKRTNALNELQVKPVFEAYTGMPEYVKPSVLMLEHMHAMRLSSGWDYSKPKNSVQQYAAKALKAYDSANALKLINEYEQWQKLQSLNEAITTAQVSLPVITIRTVLAELFPKSVAFAVFNVGQVESQSDQIPYETFEPETGMEVTVSATAFNAFTPAFTPPALNQWKDLPNHNGAPIKNVIPGTVTIGTFVEGTDYVIDYYNGRIKSLTNAFATAAATTTMALSYYAVRKGEMQPIERVRMTINFKPFTCMPNRWALMISEEAMKYSASQLNYDVRANAIKQASDWMARNIDKQLLYFALSHSLAVPSNTTTYNLTNDIDNKNTGFTYHVGVARAKLEKRYYDTEMMKLIVHTDMAERMSNSDMFKFFNERPDFALSGSNGHVGFWKGLPVFRTTEFNPDFALVVHPDLVYYRTWGGVEIQGDFPVYASSGDVTRLVAAKQWMLSVYDSMGVLRENAGSVVKIAP